MVSTTVNSPVGRKSDHRKAGVERASAHGICGRRVIADRAVAYWLIAVAALTLLMVVIGGITRLTESGLSITQWNLVGGVLPPLTHAGWASAFARYRQIPQYRDMNQGMSLEAFKGIFFWEYLHRLIGRLTGLVALVPPVVFMLQGRVKGLRLLRCLGVPVLVVAQGVLGWYMVESGLEARDSVSQYRLAAHLLLAAALYGYAVWFAADILRREPLWLASHDVRRYRLASSIVLALVLLTMTAGAFTAGTHAGFIYNTFPLMDGRLVPADYLSLSPWWRNPFENVAAIQFDHRCLAITTFVAISLFWLAGKRRKVCKTVKKPLHALMLMALIQVGLGISTLVFVVPVPLAALHQIGAFLLYTFALLTLHGLKDMSARQQRQKKA
jgi:cytochrome c oxidase assembly protein subunit 15